MRFYRRRLAAATLLGLALAIGCSCAGRNADGRSANGGPAHRKKDALNSEPPQQQQHFAHTNRLIHEKSPYLLQHAHNPVDWYPWGPEALERARREDKPIFLSIGYSTCHWCHVMERESFEDPHTASIMNASFVSIKVDREERPDLDGICMQA